MTLPSPRTVLRWIVTLAIGAAGGGLAFVAGAPLPWLLGGLFASAAMVVGDVRPMGLEPGFPNTARLICVPVIGVVIGGAFGPEVLAAMPGWWPGLVAVALFVPLAHLMNYLLFRQAAGLSHATAYFAAMPGGLIESVEIAREHEADIAVVTVLQFARIAITVTAVPLIFALIEGRVVGSAAGESLAAPAPLGPMDAAVLIACGVLGFFGATRLGVPAGQITGPILLSAAAHGFGLTVASPPALLVTVAQLVIGITLGLRFRGLDPRALGRYLGLSALSVAAMLAMGLALSLPVAAAGVAPVMVMVLSLAPGGVVEMGLIALSLQASPLFVTAHHLLRIVLTVIVAVQGWRWLSSRG